MFLSDNTSEEVSTNAHAIVYIKSSTKIKKADQIEGRNTWNIGEEQQSNQGNGGVLDLLQ